MSMAFTDLTAGWSPEKRAWSMLRHAIEPVSLIRLWRASGHADLGELIRSLDAWRRAGLIAFETPMHGIGMHHEVRRQIEPPPVPGADAPGQRRNRTNHDRIWSAARVLKRFGLVELCMSAETDRFEAVRYLTVLERAGMVRLVAGDTPDTAVWEIVRETGPFTPAVRSHGTPRSLHTRLILDLVTGPDGAIAEAIHVLAIADPELPYFFGREV